MILIALIIIWFSVRNFIEDNMKNIGILQAAGYTSRQLQAVSLLEFMGIAFGGAVLGLLMGGAGSGTIGSIQASMLGLSWSQKIDLMSAGIVLAVVLMICFSVTYSASRMYKKVPVLDALRGGIHTHNFRKNNFPMERSVFPVSIVLGGKSILGEKLKNIAVLCIVMLLSFTSCAGFFMYQNFSRDTANLLKLVGVELGTAVITGEDLEQIGAEVSKWDMVEQVLYGNTGSIKLTKGKERISLTCDIWDDPRKLENEIVLEGRIPKYENEIVVTVSAAKELGADVGDIIYVEGSGERMDYLVSGIDQKINNLGRKALMTMEGAVRLNGKSQAMSLYIYAREGYTFSKLQQELETSFTDIIITDSQKQSADTLASISGGVSLICSIFLMITVAVVIMVVMLLIKTKIRRERKNYGIYKALGFTTWQLMIQTMMSNLPVILLGTAAGAAAAKYLTNAMIALVLRFCGIQKTDMDTSFIWVLLTVGIIMTAALAVAFLCSAKIRKIEPVTLLQEEG